MVYGDAVSFTYLPLLFSLDGILVRWTLLFNTPLTKKSGLHLQLVRRRSRLARAQLHTQGRVRRGGLRAVRGRWGRVRREPAVRELQLHAHLRERARDTLLPARGGSGLLRTDPGRLSGRGWHDKGDEDFREQWLGGGYAHRDVRDVLHGTPGRWEGGKGQIGVTECGCVASFKKSK